MAKRRRRSQSIVHHRRPPHVTGFTAKPIVIRERVTVAPKKKHRRHGGGGGGGGDMFTKENTGLAIGAVVLGYIDKQTQIKIPTLPFVGRAGSIAVIAGIIGHKFRIPLATKVSKAAIVIAGYELGNKGTISGVQTV